MIRWGKKNVTYEPTDKVILRVGFGAKWWWMGSGAVIGTIGTNLAAMVGIQLALDNRNGRGVKVKVKVKWKWKWKYKTIE